MGSFGGSSPRERWLPLAGASPAAAVGDGSKVGGVEAVALLHVELQEGWFVARDDGGEVSADTLADVRWLLLALHSQLGHGALQGGGVTHLALQVLRALEGPPRPPLPKTHNTEAKRGGTDAAPLSR